MKKQDRQPLVSNSLATFWPLPAPDVPAQLATGETGLRQAADGKKLQQVGPNRIKPADTSSVWRWLIAKNRY